ncbi:hypothetical protein HDU98_003084 [Podochytrium sp. JEL0797]|nr:hypothetical protein HDU98_003084 [Podochytrium sp. JEL0797]
MTTIFSTTTLLPDTPQKPFNALQKHSIHLSIAMSATFAACFVPALAYYFVKLVWRGVDWLNFAASVAMAVNVVVNPALVLYFHESYWEACADVFYQ